MTALAKKPLCGETFNDGRCVDGWVEDDAGRLVRRCPCRYDTTLTGATARDEGIAATVDANRDAMRAALAIIRDAAHAQPTLSANDVRSRMKIAQVPGEVVGAAFRQAAKDRVLKRIGYLASTDPATHRHPVVEWASLIYGRTG